MTGSAIALNLTFHEVDEDRWPDMVRLFEGRGGPSYCWCMAWRARGAELKHTDGPSRQAAMAERIRNGMPVGVLGYIDSEPVAWCSVAPRTTYRPLIATARAAISRPRSTG